MADNWHIGQRVVKYQRDWRKGGFVSTHCTATIQRLTAKQIILHNGERYWRKNTQQVGNNQIKILDADTMERHNLHDKLRRAEYQTFPLETLRKLAEIIDAAQQGVACQKD